MLLAPSSALRADPTRADDATPVEITNCTVPNLMGMQKTLAKQGVIWLTFVNRSTRIANEVRIDVLEDGIVKGGTTQKGTYSPRGRFNLRGNVYGSVIAWR